jgi:SAM-dependent methyltransferase
MSRDLDRLRETWRALGADDPLWAILSRPDKRGGRWDADEFFAAGEVEIAAIESLCTGLGLPREHRLALDFGCGVGRLTRALATRYAEVVGVDISSSMLAQARQLHANIANVRFVENAQTRLDFLADASVDLVYSVITLHHIPAALQRGYVREFLRVLAPGGLAVFQIASGYARGWRGLGYRLLPNRVLAPLRRRVHASRVAAELHVVAESDIAAIVAAAGRRILQGVDGDSAGAGFRSRLLFVGD